MHNGGWSSRTAHRCRLLGILLATLIALAPLTACGNTEIAPPKPPADRPPLSQARAQQTLDALAKALDGHDDAAAGRLAADGARGQLAAVTANAHDLGLRSITMRYVDQLGTPTGDASDQYPEDAQVVAVQMDYRMPGWDPGATSLETSVVLVPAHGRLLVAGFGPEADRTPVWLQGRVHVVQHGRVRVIATDRRAGQTLLQRGEQALADVAAVLPGWHGRLVLEQPSSSDGLEAALAASKGQYAAIAAVTTTVDGSLARGAPVHVWVNPTVYDRLGPKGSQVVISHEATHVATGATFSGMPKWLSEGFADYVALDHAGVPLREAAGQILARVRKQGPPTDLPSPADLDPSAGGLGATYEEAWLACRFLAERYGESRLVAFYRAVDRGTALDGAFTHVLGTSRADFVAAWSADTARLADAVAG